MNQSQNIIFGHITKTAQGIFACMSHDTAIGQSLLVNGESGQDDLSLIKKSPM